MACVLFGVADGAHVHVLMEDERYRHAGMARAIFVLPSSPQKAAQVRRLMAYQKAPIAGSPRRLVHGLAFEALARTVATTCICSQRVTAETWGKDTDGLLALSSSCST
jgi:hypothetical protein